MICLPDKDFRRFKGEWLKIQKLLKDSGKDLSKILLVEEYSNIAKKG